MTVFINVFVLHCGLSTAFQIKLPYVEIKYGVQRSRASKHHLFSTCADRPDQLDSHSSWEESMRQMAAEALVPVFYPTNISVSDRSDNSNLRNTESGNSIDPEKALKKLLRRFQKIITSSENTTAEERRASRKMLADLVLGTAIMRLRHYHTLLAIIDTKQSESSDSLPCNYALAVKDVEPIMGLVGDHNYEVNALANEDHRMNVVRAMVDIHSEYMNARIGIQRECDRDTPTPTDPILNYTSEKGTTERISILYSLPIFFVEMMIEQYGEKIAEEMAMVFNEPGPITIRRNGFKCPSDDILCKRLLNDDSITAKPVYVSELGQSKDSISSLSSGGCIRLVVNDSWSPSKTSIWSLKAWKDGWFEVQDAGSQFIVKATEAAGGDCVVDYCAGNGGKTFALASQMYCEQELEKGGTIEDIKGLIVAHDIVEERLRQLRGSFDRIGLGSDDSSPASSNVVVTTTLDPEISLEKEMADVVLVDAPCSSTGVLRRRPSQRFKLDKDEIFNEFPPLQTSILKEGAELVKVGGRLVYATCSISHLENEDVVKAFESCDDFITKWERWHFDDGEVKAAAVGELGHCRALLPNVNGSDGFFIARWKRIRA